MPLIGPALSGPADLVKLLAPVVSDRPDNIALVSATTAWTWCELDRDVNWLAARRTFNGTQRHILAPTPSAGYSSGRCLFRETGCASLNSGTLRMSKNRNTSKRTGIIVLGSTCQPSCHPNIGP
jgi:hypothetical protein